MHKDVNLSGANWRKASFCSSDNGCVESAQVGETYAIRDSKAGPNGPTLLFTRAEWKGFLDGVKAGEFDYDTT